MQLKKKPLCTFLLAGILIVCLGIMPILGLQEGSQSIPSYGTISSKGFKMMFAYYYIWYEPPLLWWSSPHDPSVTDTPTLGHYSSSDIAVIDQHIDSAKQAGLDGFIVSWGMFLGKDILALIAERARLKNFKLGVLGEWNGEMGMSQYLEEIRYLIQTYGSHPTFNTLGFNGKMLIIPFRTNSHDLSFWTQIINTLHTEGLDAYFIADWTGMPLITNEWLDLFDGMTTYRPDAHECEFVKEDRQILSDYPEARTFMCPICPGFDDRHFRHGNWYAPRDKSRYYQEEFDFAKNLNSDLIVVVTWNEWYENSQIEPGTGNHSGDDPDYYLKLTKRFKEEFIRGEAPIP